MILRCLAASILARSALGQVSGPRRGSGRGTGRVRVRSRWERWVSEPRSAVLFVLVSVLVLGGGRKLLRAWRARDAIGRLDDAAVTTEEIAAAADHGRAGLMDLFRILGSAESESHRDAAGHALSVLWARDELIAEEEKALVRRGFQVRWKARRRYPRGLRAPIPIEVAYGVPFLRDDGAGVQPENLEWSHRVAGARRASLEVFSPWQAGRASARFELVPADFETDGPHRLVLQARVRTRGLTESWEFELPHIPFSFEFDPLLAVDALFALPDDTRASAFARAVRLVARRTRQEYEYEEEKEKEKKEEEGKEKGKEKNRDEEEETEDREDESSLDFVLLNESLAIRAVPRIEVKVPLPCDLAHDVEVEFEGVPGRFAAGAVSLSGQGEGRASDPERALRFLPIGPIATVPADAIERPGTRRMRARLVPDPDRGWADPDVRSIWPEAIETEWVDVEIVRR